MRRDPHGLAEYRSIELHRAIADAVLRNPSLVEIARDRLKERLARDPAPESYARAWLSWLDLPARELAMRLVRDDEQARAMRQSTPFTFVVPARERWRIWERARKAWECEP